MANSARDYVDRALDGFLRDPADSDHQRGYLGALLDVWTEGAGEPRDDRVMALKAMVIRPVEQSEARDGAPD
jgi:hypothetical protein